jgi:hypothetical protein
LKPTFGKVWDNTWATMASFHCTILYKHGYYWARDVSPSQTSSQNLVLRPSPILEKKNSSLTCIRPFLKVSQLALLEPGITFDLLRIYYLTAGAHHSIVIEKFENHLLTDNIFFMLRTSIVKPP